MSDNRTTEQTATEQLRALLDERGVEYETDDRNGLRETIWCGTAAFQLSPTAKMTMIVTPEQAVAATLGGGGECEMEYGGDVTKEKEPEFAIDKWRETHIDYTESLGEACKSLSIETYLTKDELVALVRELTRGDAE